MTSHRALTSKPPVRFHFIHRWSDWIYVVRKDLQGGEFWCKECLVCGKVKVAE